MNGSQYKSYGIRQIGLGYIVIIIVDWFHSFFFQVLSEFRTEDQFKCQLITWVLVPDFKMLRV